jgi:4-hydroxy-tetrahydrodipicolinate synthase
MAHEERVRAALASVVAIAVTPFDDGDRIDEPGYRRLLRRLVDGGITAVTPNGNTSEFYALTRDEASAALHTTLDEVGAQATVIAGIGYDARTAAIAAAEAERAGAHAVMVHQPVHPYQSVTGWVDYHAAIADATDLPIVCYVRNPLIGPAAFAALAARCPSVLGVKYAVPDVTALPVLIDATGADRLVWVCGLAETWAPFFWVAGAHGFTSGLATVAPAASLALLDALRRGEQHTAMRLWRLLRPFEELRARAGSAANVAVVKEALAQLGLCRPDVRPPSSPVSEGERAELAQVLAALPDLHPVAS